MSPDRPFVKGREHPARWSSGEPLPGRIKECDMPSAGNVDAYLATLPDDRRAWMQALRETIRAAAPDAVEVITYKMPGFESNGSFLVSYDTYKRHYSLFPASEAVI
ncbi:MAG TPA: DUF1801 domain-containing protein, partial [Candidatus Limnocylindrales bacterium]|nr:DUF1801 domain-containing protein [Candidatus Limnocylindrales bacterium]